MKRIKHTKWTKEQDTELIRLYTDTPNAKIAELFECSDKSIQNRAKNLGLRKSEAFMNSPASGRLVKGGTPWNKGLSYMPNNGATRYQKGNKPHTWLPVGSIRNRSGRPNEWVIKIFDGSNRSDNWRPYAEYVWTQAGNDAPNESEVIRMKGDFVAQSPDDFTVDRLEKISRADNMALNTIHRLPEPLKADIRALGSLRRLLNGNSR